MKSIYLILTFCIGLLAGYLLFSHAPSHKIAVATTAENSALKSIAINNDKILSEVALKKRNTLLAAQLIAANKEVADNKKELYKERLKIKKLLDQSPLDTIPLSNATMTSHLDTLNAITDSVLCRYETNSQVLESLLAVRDTQLVVCNAAYGQMKMLVDDQVARERQLTADLNTALKQQKRARIQNKFLALGMLFISGITTSLIIKAKQ